MNIKIIIDDLYKNRLTRIYADFAPALRAERQGLKVMHCKEFGKLVSEKYQRMHDISRRIYDVGGISPLYTMQGGNTELKVAIKTPKDTQRINVVGNYHPSGHDASRIVHPEGLAPTVKENHGTVTATLEPFIVASRGRNPENPSDRTAGIKTEQRLEPNTRGVCNTLTSVQKDNYVAEPVNTDVKPTLVGGIGEKNFGTQYRQGNRVYDAESVGMALQSNPVGNAGGNSYLYKHNYRIRKLTPKECWRLMGFSDEDFAKAESVNSNTQLYKQAGNSIVVNVLMAIFWELLL